MNIPETANLLWSGTVIIADADFMDRVAFDLIVNFERIIGRRIPKGDISLWAVCAALDGGVRPGENEVQVVLLHDRKNSKMENFVPSSYVQELNGQAFKDPQFGEFAFADIATGEFAGNGITMLDILRNLLEHKEVKRIVIVPDDSDEDTMVALRSVLRNADDDKRITMLNMQPITGFDCKQEILGYSVMKALGIKSEEIK